MSLLSEGSSTVALVAGWPEQLGRGPGALAAAGCRSLWDPSLWGILRHPKVHGVGRGLGVVSCQLVFHLLTPHSKARKQTLENCHWLEYLFVATFANWLQQLKRQLTVCPVLQVCCVARKGKSEKDFLKEKPMQMGY